MDQNLKNELIVTLAVSGVVYGVLAAAAWSFNKTITGAVESHRDNTKLSERIASNLSHKTLY